MPPVEGIDIGYPALAQRSDNHIVFDVVDQVTGDGTVFAGDLDTGALSVIHRASGAPGLPAFGVPGYNGDDSLVVFSIPDPFPGELTGYSLEAQPMAADRLTPTGDSFPWIFDADLGVVYRRGDVRTRARIRRARDHCDRGTRPPAPPLTRRGIVLSFPVRGPVV